MIPLRPYQQKVADEIKAQWAGGVPNVLAVLPTGGGKTVIFSDIIDMMRASGPSCAIAHRQELVGQMSMALARCRVVHRIIAPRDVIKKIVGQQVDKLGRSFYDPGASCAVAGVDTIVRRHEELAGWLNTVRFWVTDEAHHLLVKNKWGKTVEMFPNAFGLGVTATPTRADGFGLGRHADGVFDSLIVGPSMRELINDGWLTDYRIFAPQSDLNMEGERISATGDWSSQQLKKAAKKSHIVGDVVAHYQRIAPGKLGVVFAPDVETAMDISAQFNKAGVPAEVVTAKTPNSVRTEILNRFERREIQVLVNVDLFGEGFDLPAIEVVSMARPTESFALFVQQFGRALRIMLEGPTPEDRDARLAAIAMSGKPRAIIIDHVGNVTRHGLPDAPREWSLDRRDKRARTAADDAIPIRACLNPECLQVYERVKPECPYCGFRPTPANRSAPEFVDGDLTELDPAVLARMRGEVLRVDMDAETYRAELIAKHVPLIGQAAQVKRHKERQDVQQGLRASMAWWAGIQRSKGRSDVESYRRFFHRFGIDVLSAQALPSGSAMELTERINAVIVDESVNSN